MELISECVICLDAKRCIVFSPCGHLCLCEECARPMKQCPMCQQECKDKMKIYI